MKRGARTVAGIESNFFPSLLILLGGWLGGATATPAAEILVNPPAQLIPIGAVPVRVPVDLSRLPGKTDAAAAFQLRPTGDAQPNTGAILPAQFEPNAPGSLKGKLWWLLPAGQGATRRYTLISAPTPQVPEMQVRRDARGQWDITEAGQPVLSFNYQTNEPGDRLAKIHTNNLKYAQPRGDYLHPIHGLAGEVLTQDWSVDHPHHRGLYWAWPEVMYRGELGDLHALQRVFARPTGVCSGQGGPVFAQITAENRWLWEDREPLVHERAIIRAWHTTPAGRSLDLEFHFTALQDDVSIARRETKLYGGLNLRLAAVREQQIQCFMDPAHTQPRRAWAEISGGFAGSESRTTGLAIFQFPGNPDYPGDWVQYPELNWLQPTFPAAGTRYLLKKDQPLVLRFRLWIHSGRADESTLADQWAAFANPPQPQIQY